jgi:DNA-binding response OmpR family regulator
MAYILIVEDDKDISDILCGMFGKEGHYCFAASSEKIVERLTQNFIPDLMITDFFLENGNGLEVARSAEAVNVPVIVISGDHTKGDEVREAGFFFLEKPFKLSEIRMAASVLLKAPMKSGAGDR